MDLRALPGSAGRQRRPRRTRLRGVTDTPGRRRHGDGLRQEPVYFTGADNKRNVDAPVRSLRQARTRRSPSTSRSRALRAAAIPGIASDPRHRHRSRERTGDRDLALHHALPRGATWDIDVTDLRPLLTGDVTLRGFIDTWVGARGMVAVGQLRDEGGHPRGAPVAVMPVWTRSAPCTAIRPSPSRRRCRPQTLIAAGGRVSFALRTFVTGHGQGNPKTARSSARRHTRSRWARRRTKPRYGGPTARRRPLPTSRERSSTRRARLVPRRRREPWTFDITADVAGGMASIAYDVEAYVNTCRPDASPAGGCTLGSEVRTTAAPTPNRTG